MSNSSETAPGLKPSGHRPVRTTGFPNDRMGDCLIGVNFQAAANKVTGILLLIGTDDEHPLGYTKRRSAFENANESDVFYPICKRMNR